VIIDLIFIIREIILKLRKNDEWSAVQIHCRG